MKVLNCNLRSFPILFLPLLLLLLTNCNKEEEPIIPEKEMEEEEIPITDAWICELKSFEEDYWSYDISLENNGDYIAISKTRILRVSKDGVLNSMTMISYPDENTSIVRIYNGKFYRFHYDNEFEYFDPTEPINLQIYNSDFTLLSDHLLESGGLIYDVEIESDNLFGMLVYNVDEKTMTLKKLDLNGLISEAVLSTTGTHPTNLHILETGDYFCTASSSLKNLALLDNDLNVLWQKENNAYTISDAQYVSGQGIYITGRGTPFGDYEDLSFVALLDMNGNETASMGYDANERRSPFMAINDERIFLIQTEAENRKNLLLTTLEYDLNIDDSMVIPGNKVLSDIVINEVGGFSFLYGLAIDPNDPDWSPPSNSRIFKFDDSYTLPTTIIVQ